MAPGRTTIDPQLLADFQSTLKTAQAVLETNSKAISDVLVLTEKVDCLTRTIDVYIATHTQEYKQTVVAMDNIKTRVDKHDKDMYYGNGEKPWKEKLNALWDKDQRGQDILNKVNASLIVAVASPLITAAIMWFFFSKIP